jgi:hypothetical protein
MTVVSLIWHVRCLFILAFSASMQGSNYSMQNQPCLVRQTSLMYAIYTVLTAIGGLIERGGEQDYLSAEQWREIIRRTFKKTKNSRCNVGWW